MEADFPEENRAELAETFYTVAGGVLLEGLLLGNVSGVF